MLCKKLKIIILLIVLFPSIGISQFLDFNLFSPRITLNSDFILPNPDDSTSLNIRNYNASYIFPIKNNFEIETSWKDLFKLKKLKDLTKVIKPKFSQTFGRINAGYQTISTDDLGEHNLYQAGFGITGITAKFKGITPNFFFYSFNVNVTEEWDKYSSFQPNVNLLLGKGKVLDLRNFIMYGAYFGYYDRRFFPIPFIVWSNRWDKQTTFTLILPLQAKLSFKVSKVYRTDFAVSINTQNHGMWHNNFIDSIPTERLSFSRLGVKFGWQNRIKFNKNWFLYLEAGWQDFNRYGYYDRDDRLSKHQPDGFFYFRTSLAYRFKRGMINPEFLDFGF